MTRFVTGAIAASAAVAALLVAAPAYADVTNPANNPHKITVTGDDGKTYVDGQDTLPGFDDEACTYIPGAWFDFDNNRVRYADGQSIPWTEWDRATGYQDWLAKKNASSGSTGTTGTGAQPVTTSGTSGAQKPASSGSTSGNAANGSGTSAPAAAPSVSAAPTASAAPTIEVFAASEEPSADASPSASPSAEALAASPGSGTSNGSGSAAGLAILAVLFGVGGAAFGGYTFLKRGKASTRPAA